MNCCFISNTITEELRRQKKMCSATDRGIGAGRDLGSRERDGIGTELRGTGTRVGRLLAGTGGDRNGQETHQEMR